MSAPRPTVDPVPLNQVFPPDVVKLIWLGEATLVVMLLAGSGLLIFRIAFHLVQVIRGKEPLRLLSEQSFRLTYKIPKEFGRYIEHRDGWKMYLPWIAQLLVFSLCGCIATALFHLHPPELSTFLIIFFGVGLMLFGMMSFQRDRDQAITFYKEGIGNRPKGSKTPYSRYARVCIEEAHFDGIRFRLVRFIPKRPTWQTMPDEYGFSTDTDITSLLALLSEQGLPIEGIIQSARGSGSR